MALMADQIISELENIRLHLLLTQNDPSQYKKMESTIYDATEAVMSAEYYGDLFHYVNAIDPDVMSKALDAVHTKRKLKESTDV